MIYITENSYFQRRYFFSNLILLLFIYLYIFYLFIYILFIYFWYNIVGECKVLIVFTGLVLKVSSQICACNINVPAVVGHVAISKSTPGGRYVTSRHLLAVNFLWNDVAALSNGAKLSNLDIGGLVRTHNDGLQQVLNQGRMQEVAAGGALLVSNFGALEQS